MPDNAPELLLSIVVPTYRERENVGILVEKLDQVLKDIAWEVIFVDDDSNDQTAAFLHEMGRKDRRVCCLHRIGRRGLSSACIEGMLASPAPFIAVMDADLQHDESILPKMLATLTSGDTDIVVGSRYVEGGGIGNWDSSRAKISQFATKLGKLLTRVELNDPMSGFFMLRREVLHESVRNLSGIGFKILLDILASSPRPLRLREVPFQFRTRVAGESKLDSLVAWEFGMLLIDKTIGSYIPTRFVTFCLIGAGGVVVHFATLALLFQQLSVNFTWAQTVATIIAMTFNFIANNFLTYRDMRLRGRQMIAGWFSFVAACSIGAAANVGIASYLFETKTYWVLSAFAGIVIGAVWNYVITSMYTWKKKAS